MPWKYLKKEDFNDIHLHDNSTRLDVLVAVAKRASSIDNQAKKKRKDLKPDLSFVSNKSGVCFALGTGTSSGSIHHQVIINKKRRKKGNKKKKNTDCSYNASNIEIPHLPIGYKETLASFNKGLKIENEVLEIQKEVTVSDIRKQQNRFSIPSNHIMNNFLNDDEIKILDSYEDNGTNLKRLDVNMIDAKQVKH